MIPHCPNDGGTSRPRRLARAGRPGGLTPNPDRTRVIPWTCRPSGASGRGSDLDRPRDLMRAPPKASVTVASQRQRVRHRLPLRGKERTCRSRPRKPAPSSEASALVRTCTVPLRRGRGPEPDTTSAPRPSRRPGPTRDLMMGASLTAQNASVTVASQRQLLKAAAPTPTLEPVKTACTTNIRQRCVLGRTTGGCEQTCPAGVAPGPQTARRRTGGSHHRAASGAAAEGHMPTEHAPGWRGGSSSSAIVESHQPRRPSGRTLQKTILYAASIQYCVIPRAVAEALRGEPAGPGSIRNLTPGLSRRVRGREAGATGQGPALNRTLPTRRCGLALGNRRRRRRRLHSSGPALCHCAAVVDRNRTRHRPRGLLDDPGRLVWRLANLWHKCSRSCGGSIGRSGPPGKGRSSRCR